MLKKLRKDCADALEAATASATPAQEEETVPLGATLDEDSSSSEEEDEEWCEPPPRGPGIRVAQTFAAVQAASAADAAEADVSVMMDPALQLCVSILGSAEAVVEAARHGMDEHQRALLDQAQSLQSLSNLTETFEEGDGGGGEDVFSALMDSLA